MKVNTYACDVCGAQKREANHWFVVVIEDYSLCLYQWADAPIEADNARHLCGVECLSKFINKTLTEQPNQTNDQTNERTTK